MKIIERFVRTILRAKVLCLAVGCISLAFTANADPTNAPPVAPSAPPGPEVTGRHAHESFWRRFGEANHEALSTPAYTPPPPLPPGSNAPPQANQIGRASCRERV